MSDRVLGALLCIVAASMFASTGVFARLAMEGGLDASQVAAVRTYGGALLLLPFVIRARRGYTRAMLLPVLVYALVGVFGSQGLYFQTISRMDIALALVLSYVAPLVVALYQRVRAGERLPLYAYAAMVVAVGGLALAVLGGRGVDGVSATGLALGIATMLTFAVMLIASPRQPQGVGALARAGAPILVAAVAWFVVVPAWTVPWDRMGDTVAFTGGVDIALPLWSAIAWTILVGAVLSFAVVLAGSARIGAGAASMFSMAEPVFGALFAWILLGQDLAPVQVLGILVTVVAVAVVERARTRTIRRLELVDPVAPLIEVERR